MQKINYDELYTESDINTGENIFYLDKELKVPYNGVVLDYFNGLLSWEFEVKEGFRTGMEKTYYDSGELMEENETDHNTINGLAKEFYKNGKLKTIAIVIRNVPIDTITYDELGNILKKVSINKNNSSYFLVASKITEYRKKYNIE